MWRPTVNEFALIIVSGAFVALNFIQAAGEATARMTAEKSEKNEHAVIPTTIWPNDTRATAKSMVNKAHIVNNTYGNEGEYRKQLTKSQLSRNQLITNELNNNQLNNSQLSSNQLTNNELSARQKWSAIRGEQRESTSKGANKTLINTMGNRTYSLPSIGGRNFQRRQTFYEYCMEQRNSVADLSTLVLYSFVCVVGLCGNTLVIYVVLRYSKMQTVTNIYILNLAIADECFLIGIPFLLYTMRICSWRFGDFMCKVYMVSSSITQFTSSIFLLIMSADRYIAVCHPIASPKYRTQRIAKIVSAIAWLTSVVLMLPVILYASTVSQEDGVNLSCNIEWPETYKKHSATTFTLYTFLLGFTTPLCFILCFYYLVIRKLHTVGSKHKSKEKKRSHRKVTRLVLTVITVYIFCWLPYWVSQLALINSNPTENQLSRFEIFIFLLLFFLIYLNSAMNPILYAFLSDNFRKSFFKAFTCMTKSEVNAQLHGEPSLLAKQSSAKRRQKRPPKSITNDANLVATTNANNNSSVTTSSTNTAPAACEKLTTMATSDGTVVATQQVCNGRAAILRPSNAGGAGGGAGGGGGGGEEMILVLEHERPMCAIFDCNDAYAAADTVIQTDL